MTDDTTTRHDAAEAPPRSTDTADSTLPFDGQADAEERYTTVGQELRRERELREITLQEISEDTKISIRNLKAIEDNEFHRLPGGIYTKNFIRAYCRYLGINQEKMVNQYLYQTSPREPSMARDATGFDGSRSGAPWKGLALAVLALAALATVVTMVLLRPGWFGLASEPATPPAGQQQAGAAASDVFGPPVPLNFAFRADADTWIVVEVDGQPRMNRHLKRGEFFEVKAEERIVLGVEDAGVLAWTINGRTARPLGESGQVVNDVSIGQDNWRSWLGEPPAQPTDGS